MDHVKELSAEEVKQQLEEGKDLHIIDVRENEEVAEGMIAQAKHIPMGDIPMNLEELDQDKPYILVCRSGKRSENVAYFLLDHGYDVTNMVGGMLAWTGETTPKK